jgi:O-Antigen ligase
MERIMIPELVQGPQRLAQLPVERDAVMLQGSGWLRVARFILWAIVVTASVKPNEIFGMGEQAVTDASSPLDLAFRCAVLVGCLFTTFIALVAGRVRLATLCFVPFGIWGVLVAIGQQASLSSSKQLGSYATWILFFISACALFDEPEGFANLRVVLLLSALMSAIGGVLECILGHAPMIGLSWENMGFTRIHTGGGGILLDACTPYFAAILLLVSSGKRPVLMIGGILLALWGSGDILRGGMVGFSVAIIWLMIVARKGLRLKLLIGVVGTALLVGIVFGSKVAQKSVTDDDEINTSGRIENWPQLIGWIQDEPLWGHGPNADMDLLAKSDSSDLRVSHNELLSTAVNYGTIGTALLWCPLILILFISLRLTYKHRSVCPEPLLAASGILLMLIILSFTDNTLRLPGIMILALAPAAVAFNWCLHFQSALELAGQSA